MYINESVNIVMFLGAAFILTELREMTYLCRVMFCFLSIY